MDKITGKRKLPKQKYNNFLVIELAYSQKRENHGGYRHFWKCRCACGNEKIVREDHLKSGEVKSCGCIYGEKENSNSIKIKEIVNLYEKINQLKAENEDLKKKLEIEKQAKLDFRQDNIKLRVALKDKTEKPNSFFDDMCKWS